MEATLQRTQFITLAIGATARHMGITATELHNQLKRHGLVKRVLIDCYDTLHAESIDGVVWNVEQALKNWELREQRGQSDACISVAESRPKETEGQMMEGGAR